MSTARRIAVGVLAANNTHDALLVYDADLTLLWTVKHGATVNAVAMDDDGNVYMGGNRNSTAAVTTRALDRDGNSLWTADHGLSVNGIAVDGSGNVSTAGSRGTGSGNNTLRTYDDAGTETSTIDTGRVQYAVTLAADTVSSAASQRLVAGNNYAATGNSGQVRQYRDNNTRKWTLQTEGSSRSIRAAASGHAGGVGSDEYGNFFVAGTQVDSKTTLKYDISRTLQWHKDDGGQCNALALSADHSRLAIGFNRNSNLSVRVRNPANGDELWSFDAGANVNGVAWDADNNLYVVTDSYNSGSGDYAHLYVLNSDGDQIDLLMLPQAFYGAYAVAVRDITIPDRVDTSPGLPFPIALALPFGTGFLTLSAGLPLPLAVRAPASIVPLPPDPVGRQPVYRGYVSLGADLIELTLASFQCQRRQNESTWLTLDVLATAALATALNDAIGATVTVHAGVRYSDGTEDLGLMLRAIITEALPETAPGAIRVTVRARVQVDLEPLQARVAYGVSQYQTENGRRQVRCAVDPRLRPGDHLIVGAETLLAHTVTYRIAPGEAWMDVREPPLG